MLTDNNVLVGNLNEEPVLMCVQRKAEKKLSNEEDLVQSNIDSFGNDIGKITNWVTSMYEVRSKYDDNSNEYNTLTYRIQCGELYQQEAIDRSKGIISDPMPKYWYDRHTVNKIEDINAREFQRSIVADKKPYFMRYIYPELMRDYNTFIRNTTKNSLRKFSVGVPELRDTLEDQRTNEMDEFLKYYDYQMPVGVNDCTMNRICRRFEEEFDGYIGKSDSVHKFDYTIMRSDAEYSKAQYYEVKKLYEEYNKRLQNMKVYAAYERTDKYEYNAELDILNDEFQRECYAICSNEDMLCNIILDLCYSKNSTRKFAWEMCGDVIIRNLLGHNEHVMSYPAKDPDGDIEYKGCRFSLKTREVIEEDVDSLE